MRDVALDSRQAPRTYGAYHPTLGKHHLLERVHHVDQVGPRRHPDVAVLPRAITADAI